MISAKEEPDAPISPAMDGLLRVHKCIIDSTDGQSSQALPGTGNMVPTRLLVVASQAGSLIGKQGATIKSIQEATKSVVRILGMSALNFLLFVYCLTDFDVHLYDKLNFVVPFHPILFP